MKRAAVVIFICTVVVVVIGGGYYLSTRDAADRPARPAPMPAPTRATIPERPDEVVRAPISVPVEPARDEPDPPGLVISGSATTVTGEPAAGAVVAAYSAETAAIRATAKEDGTFRVVGLRPGAYRVSGALEHYNEAVVEGVKAGASNVALVLEPLSAVEGKVIDGQNNQPLAQFEVLYLEIPPGDESHWQNIIRGENTKWTRVSNEEGKYRIDDVVSVSKFAVAAGAEGFEPAYVEIAPLKAGETGQAPDIVLLPEAKILGRVVSGDKRPLSGADIYFGQEARGRTAARSNPDGRFTLDRLPPGPVTLTAAHRDHLPATVEANLERGEETEVEIVLGGGGSIQGTVLDGAVPLPHQTIMALRLTPPRTRKDAITDDNGIYTIEGLPPGDVEVIAKLQRAGNTDPVPVRLQKVALVEDGQVTTVDFQLADASSSIEGLITLAGEPPALAIVKGFVAGEAGDTFFNTSANSDGSYAVGNLPAGDAWLEVTVRPLDGHERRKNIPVTVPPGATVRQDIQYDASAVIYGTISTLADGEGGEVMAVMGPYPFDPSKLGIDELQELERLEVGSSVISPDGSYRLSGLDPGTYTVIVIAFDPEQSELLDIRTGSQTVTVVGDQELQVDLVVS